MTVTRHASSFAVVATTGSNVYASVVIPSGAVIGDVAVITLFVYAPFQGTTAAPSGWTKLGSPSGGGSIASVVVFWKILIAADLGSTVVISGMGGNNNIVVSVEVWGGALAPTSVFPAKSTSNQYTLPSAPAATGSIPLYIWAGYDTASCTPPSALTPPAGWSGSYNANTFAVNGTGLGVWFTNPTAGTSAPGGTLTPSGGSGTGAYTVMATIILPPSVTQNAYLIGANAGADTLCTTTLIGANAGADTTLLWTP